MKNNDFPENTHPGGGTENSKKNVLAPRKKVMKSLSPQGVVLLIKPIENNEFAPPKPSGKRQGFLYGLGFGVIYIYIYIYIYINIYIYSQYRTI